MVVPVFLPSVVGSRSLASMYPASPAAGEAAFKKRAGEVTPLASADKTNVLREHVSRPSGLQCSLTLPRAKIILTPDLFWCVRK